MDCCGSSRTDKEPEMKSGSVRLTKEECKKKDDEAAAKKTGDIQDALKGAKNRFTNSKRFRDMVANSFQEVDIDKSNSLDANEVYIAVLILYLKISGVCKGAVPPDRSDIVDLMAKFDSPKTPGALDYEHYEMFCQFLCSQIAGRVALQMFMQLVLAPMLGLLACTQWEKLMEKYAPELFAFCTSYVPTDVIMTLFVGVAVGLFVPPLMNLVDSIVLKHAHHAKKNEENTEVKSYWWSSKTAAKKV